MALILSSTVTPCARTYRGLDTRTPSRALHRSLSSRAASVTSGSTLRLQACTPRAVATARSRLMPVFAGLSTGRVRITVQGKHLEVTEAINGYIDEKIGHAVQPFEEALRVREELKLVTKFERFHANTYAFYVLFPRTTPSEVDVKCSARGGENSGGPKLQTVEATVYTKKHVFRAEDVEDNLYAAIDKVADKLARKLRKTKERAKKVKGSPTAREMEVGDDAPLVKEGVQGEPVLPEEVIRTKYFTMPRMTVEQAIDNLEMVDHDFYAFQEADSGKIQVLYKRSAGGYGLIVAVPTEE